MTIFLLSLGGFPPFGGFIAKWYVFTAALQAGYVGLAIIGVLTSVVSVFFYLRVVVMMYMTPPSGEPMPVLPTKAPARRSFFGPGRRFTLGSFPPMLDWVAASVGTLFCVQPRDISRRFPKTRRRSSPIR